jgi:hypothetical protein
MSILCLDCLLNGALETNQSLILTSTNLGNITLSLAIGFGDVSLDESLFRFEPPAAAVTATRGEVLATATIELDVSPR